MPNVTQTVPSYLGGVSRQSDDKKLPGQVIDCINGYPDPTFGLTKRPGFKFLKDMGLQDTLTDAKWFYIHRDGDEKYIGCIKGTVFHIWNCTSGVKSTVTITSPAADYLTGTKSSDYDVLTVQDTTIITNKTVTASSLAAPSFTANQVGTVKIAAITPNTEYVVSVKIGSTTHTAKYTTGDDADVEDILTGLNTGANGTDGTYTNVANAANGLNGITNVTGTVIETSLELSISTGSFTLTGHGGPDKERLRTFQNQVANVSQLPDHGKHHRVVKVVNTANVGQDTYYSRFIADDSVSGNGHWQEFISPEASTGLNAATMPHELVNTGTNAFTFRQATWTERLVGDGATNSHPSFVGQKIQQAFFASNRLGFLTKDNISMSQSGEYFNFYHVSAMTQIASDPVDLSTSSIRPTLLTGVLPTAQGLILFSKNQQFMVFAPNGIFTPSTTIIRGISNYEMDINIDPVDNGTNIIFLSKTPGYTRIYQMSTRGQEMNPIVLDIGRVVSEWVPDSVTELLASPQNSFVAMYGPTKKDIYFYRTYSDGQKEVMQSWFRWELPGKVQFLAVDNDVLYAATEQSNQITLSSASLNQTPEETILVNSEGQKMNPCVDLYETATSVKFKGVDDFTVTAGGTGYTSAPTVTITPVQAGEGSGATATATVAGGAVTGVTLTASGSGFTEGATVAFSGGGGSGAAATCTVLNGTKCYIPFTNDSGLSPLLVVGSDPAALTNPTFVESGFTSNPTAGSDDTGSYFSIAEKDLSSVAARVIVGYKYTYDIEIPKTYFKLDQQGTQSDYTATLTISRMKFSTGLSGVVGFKLKIKGAADYTDIKPTIMANYSLANDVPLSNQATHTVAIHQKSTNFSLRVYSDTPFPVSLNSMMWEGYYSPRFYQRA